MLGGFQQTAVTINSQRGKAAAERLSLVHVTVWANTASVGALPDFTAV
jgi:hypothetical protein